MGAGSLDPLDEGPRPKSGRLRLKLHGTCFGGKINWLDPKTVLKGELLIWRTKNQARDQDRVQLKDSICFSPNWFLGNWTLYPRLKWA
jgi:hypothetical protein